MLFAHCLQEFRKSMMQHTEQVSCKSLTTLKVGGFVRHVVTVTSPEDLEEARTFIHAKALPFVVLGEGSNVLPSDDTFEGVVVLMRIPGISFQSEGDSVRVTVGAGVIWEELVTSVADKGLWGLENLAGIPGTVGAAPVQNIGAYGAEFSTVCVRVSGMNMRTGEHFSFSEDECAFGYRDSVFKHRKELVITEVVLTLHTQSAPKLGYSDLARLHREGVLLTTPEEINTAVRAVRALKFPDLAVQGTAGSFFKNPIVTHERFAQLSATHGAIPSFPAKNGIKIPLAYILDHLLGLKGIKHGHVSLFGNQPLVLVTDEGATAKEVDEFAYAIEKKVFDATEIKIQREVQKVFQK